MAEKKTVEQLLTEYDPHQKTIVNFVKDAEDSGIRTLKVDIKRRAPVRSETPPRAHVFKDMDGFVKYLNAYGDTDTLVMCDPETARFYAVLDEAKEEGVERIMFIPQPHPAFVEWQQVLDRLLDFPTLAQFINRQRRTIADGAKLAGLLRQIKASTKVELHNGVGNGAVNGIMYTCKIQSQDKNAEADLPETIAVDIPIYIDSPAPTHLEIDLTLEARDEGKKVMAVLSAPTLKVELFKALQLYAASCNDFQFGFGVPGWSDWKYQQ